MKNNLDERFFIIKKLLVGRMYNLADEIETQDVIEKIFIKNKMIYFREYQLSKSDKIDFMVGDIGLEIKVKGNADKTLSQLERYLEYDSVKAIILATSFFIGLPKMSNNKPLYLIHLSRGML